MSAEPLTQDILRDFHQGFVWLKFNLYKPSGKWAYGGWVKCNHEQLQELVHKEGRSLLDYIESIQDEVVKGAFKGYFVTLDDSGMNFLEAYHSFYSRMYHPL